VIWAGIVFGVVLRHQGTAIVLLLAQAGLPGQYAGVLWPDQMRVAPPARLMTSTLP